MTIIIVLVVVAVLVLFFISLYNRLVRLRNTRENAFADIDVQLKQRYDLIPQLVETVRGYMKHESETLKAVTEARTRAMAAGTIDEKIAAEQQLSTLLGNVKVAVEAYPDLKANQNFLSLQEEMSDIENKLAAARRYFNSATRELNVSVESFPANIVAGMFGFHKETMFDLGTEQRQTLDKAPEVKF